MTVAPTGAESDRLRVAAATAFVALHAPPSSRVSTSKRGGGMVVKQGEEDEEQLQGDEEALVEAELHFGLAHELDPENEVIQTSHETFLELLQAKANGK